VIGGVAKNFMPLLLKVLKINKKIKALEPLAIKYLGILQIKYDLSCKQYQLKHQQDREQCTPNYTTQRVLSSWL
jgi:hypothetical protein